LEFGEGLELKRSQEVPLITIEVRKISDGLGYGDGGISYNDRETEVGNELLQAVEDAIRNPDEILVPISLDKKGSPIDDDGCGDGRGVKRIFEGAIERLKSLVRSKVFGGGATMIASTRIGLGKANGKSVKEVFSDSIAKTKKKGIGFGAHTDDHAKESNSGCRAIDDAPEIIQNAVRFRKNIESSIEILGINTSGLNEVFDNFEKFAESVEDHPHAGVEVIDEIKEADKVVKELEGPHLEMYIVLNNVKGFTVNQEIIRKISDGKIQVFGIDIWRLWDLVQKAYPDESAEDQHKAFLSELVYSLATAATLTKGDLPVFVISKQLEPMAA